MVHPKCLLRLEEQLARRPPSGAGSGDSTDKQRIHLARERRFLGQRRHFEKLTNVLRPRPDKGPFFSLLQTFYKFHFPLLMKEISAKDTRHIYGGLWEEGVKELWGGAQQASKTVQQVGPTTELQKLSKCVRTEVDRKWTAVPYAGGRAKLLRKGKCCNGSTGACDVHRAGLLMRQSPTFVHLAPTPLKAEKEEMWRRRASESL